MLNEKLALKIAMKLKGLCPAFIFNHANTAVWHGCDCKVSGSSCECVHQLKSSCNGGKWNELDFVDKHHRKEQSKRDEMLDEVIAARHHD